MPRLPRNYNYTQIFHVITQGINKNYIFEISEDIKYYIKVMYLLVKEQNIEIVAYCIMNNHAHILIKASNIEELSKYMQRLNTRYGQYYNKKYNRVGYVFRNRYKAEGIYSEEHLYNCIKYIYDNPVKAGICNKASEYPYSNYKMINQSVEEKYLFIEVEDRNEKHIKRIINNYFVKNQITVEKLRQDKELLKRTIILLKDEYGISLRAIADSVKINREKIRRIYNQK